MIFEISYDELTNIFEASDYRDKRDEEEIGKVYRTEYHDLFDESYSYQTSEFWMLVKADNLGLAFIDGWQKILNYIKDNKIELNKFIDPFKER